MIRITICAKPVEQSVFFVLLIVLWTNYVLFSFAKPNFVAHGCKVEFFPKITLFLPFFLPKNMTEVLLKILSVQKLCLSRIACQFMVIFTLGCLYLTTTVPNLRSTVCVVGTTLTLYILRSQCIFSILFSRHFLRC